MFNVFFVVFFVFKLIETVIINYMNKITILLINTINGTLLIINHTIHTIQFKL